MSSFVNPDCTPVALCSLFIRYVLYNVRAKTTESNKVLHNHESLNDIEDLRVEGIQALNSLWVPKERLTVSTSDRPHADTATVSKPNGAVTTSTQVFRWYKAYTRKHRITAMNVWVMVDKLPGNFANAVQAFWLFGVWNRKINTGIYPRRVR